jgi:hypothetical protein
LQSPALIASSAMNPRTVIRERESAPPVTTASHTPPSINAAAWAMAWALDAVGHRAGAGDRVVGETGPPGTPEQGARQRDYWRLLWQVAEAAIRRGGTWPDAALLQAGPAEWLGDPRHLLNAQRAWRLAEDEWLSAPPR